jgi:hypothetical protein
MLNNPTAARAVADRFAPPTYDSSIISRSSPILTARQQMEQSVNGSSRDLSGLLGLGCDVGTVFIPE